MVQSSVGAYLVKISTFDEIVFYPVYINTMYNIVIVLVGIHANTPLADHREALTTNRHTRGYTTVRGSS